MWITREKNLVCNYLVLIEIQSNSAANVNSWLGVQKMKYNLSPFHNNDFCPLVQITKRRGTLAIQF